MPLTIVWDWNGTLLADTDTAVGALNRLLSSRGVPVVDRSRYRDRFGFPVRPFYAELGIDLEREDWDLICSDFHRFISMEPKPALRPDATAALETARAAGADQTIVSALRQDFLLRDTAEAGISVYFSRIYGVDNLDGASKLDRAKDLARDVGPGRRIVFIGDTLHDAEVASALGAECILVDGGHQTRERLLAAGVPVADSLVQAVQLACADGG